MAKLKAGHFLLIIVMIAAFAGGGWALYSLAVQTPSPYEPSFATAPRAYDPDLWARSMERVKEDRGGIGNVGIEIPDELRHYDDRRWFLATQVAEVKKHNLQPVQDFVDLAAMIKRGELVSLPAVTDTYLLYGVGARVDGDPFTRYVANENLELNDEAGLRDAYARLESERAKLQNEISDLKSHLGIPRNSSTQPQAHDSSSAKLEVRKGGLPPLKSQQHSTSTKQEDQDLELLTRQQKLKSIEQNKAFLNQYYGQPNGSTSSQPRLLKDYDSLQTLAKDFGGRSFNLEDPTDRETLKVYLLSSLRPPALRVLEEIAKAYHDKFDRPLPVSSLVRPEQYQRALRRVNRYAVIIDTPPHSTGLAFDIDYKFMSGAEQNFVMNELARLKQEGRIEVLRERGANYHVFAFIDGQRPSDDLITASLDESGKPVKQTAEAEEEPAPKTSAKSQSKSRPAKRTVSKTKKKRR